MPFNSPPKVSQFRAWATSLGYTRKAESVSAPEIWIDSEGRWRLKIKHPAERAGLHPRSYEQRYSCREINPATDQLEYYDPVTGMFGTRNSMGHLEVVID